ncbi:uncharacterized protein LAESUDRAFT_736565 [Laetiporus sulphureus 93-53]|uniref:Uncharacterized protein n=1 Tax=Laetiporus sulphureus 93-53 TaxID=1314785 RepID=A0A165EFK8_9APHY|nr:uncharacterized protein LAESUDRAFT_736565 [Laetiporus sulphureus 93-53]KZT06953.1 hypothetical protein LAESUDRAFT_736565 [Laetiporus sulphureus 93-53]
MAMCVRWGEERSDSLRQVVAVLAGAPNDPSWNAVHSQAAKAMENVREYAACGTGVSYGGGQKCPGNLVNSEINGKMLECLLQDHNISRIAGFASSAFETWAPKLYKYYVDHLQPLYTKYFELKRNFANSIFAGTTFNFGPATCTVDHRDSANLAFGWCSVTALGDFNPMLDGHLVLWDMKLVIEFPPSSTILIPSAIILHSNVAIGEGESRSSFMQYTAGSLFQWVDLGFQPISVYCEGLNSAEKKAEELQAREHWEIGMDMFSALSFL